ncbi:MAG: FAD-dependent oxidoreductase [Bryobacteraceae bacterium]
MSGVVKGVAPFGKCCVRGAASRPTPGSHPSRSGPHASTRNTVSCMGQGQAAGTAAALCAVRNCGTRELRHAALRSALEKGNVYFEG